MKKQIAALVFSALVASASVAIAEVTWTPEAGGFVGKGDVQTLFGWNNATMQANHTSMTFEYDVNATFSFECEWWTGPTHNRRHHVNTKEIAVSVAAEIASQSRRSGQSPNYTGWNLSPLEGTIELDGPTDDDCGAEGNDMKSIVPGSVELISASGGSLYAVYGDDRRLLQSY